MRAKNYKNWLSENDSYNVDDYTKFKGSGKTIKDLLKRAGHSLGDYFQVMDNKDRTWSVYTDRSNPGDTSVYAMDINGEESELDMADIKFIVEGDTSEYTPPKYLVSPPLDQNGDGEVDDEIDEYLTKEFAKSRTYFQPGIKTGGNADYK